METIRTVDGKNVLPETQFVDIRHRVESKRVLYVGAPNSRAWDKKMKQHS